MPDHQVEGQMDPKSGAGKSGAGFVVRQATDSIGERFKIDLANELACYRPDITRKTAHDLATGGHLLLQPGMHTMSAYDARQTGTALAHSC